MVADSKFFGLRSQAGRSRAVPKAGPAAYRNSAIWKRRSVICSKN